MGFAPSIPRETGQGAPPVDKDRQLSTRFKPLFLHRNSNICSILTPKTDRKQGKTWIFSSIVGTLTASRIWASKCSIWLPKCGLTPRKGGPGQASEPCGS